MSTSMGSKIARTSCGVALRAMVGLSLSAIVVACHDDPFGECVDAYAECLDDVPFAQHETCEVIKDACLEARLHDDDDDEGGDGSTSSCEASRTSTETTSAAESAGTSASSDVPSTSTSTGDAGTTSTSTGDASGESSTTGASTSGTSVFDASSDASGSTEPGESGSDSGSDETTAGEPTEPEVVSVCFALHVTCVQRARSIADVDACGALFDQCVIARSCTEDCSEACPSPDLQTCLDAYVGCADTATTAELELGCVTDFETCAGRLTDEHCMPEHAPEVVEPCLAQHALCARCIDDVADLHVCQDVFQACLDAASAPS